VNLNDISNEVTKKVDLLTVNYFPLSFSHSNLTINYDQDFPQVLSNEFIFQLLQLFSIAKNNSLVCGYDSLGGGCLINHLHFEILFLQDFKNIKQLPIELADKSLLFSSNFQPKDETELSMFDTNVKFSLFLIYTPVKAFRIEVTEKTQTEDKLFLQNSISNGINLILSHLIEDELPHNVIITENGCVAYVIPRQFDNMINYLPVNSCWNDVAGLVTFKNEVEFEKVNEEEEVMKYLSAVSFDDEKFGKLANKIHELFDKIYVLYKE